MPALGAQPLSSAWRSSLAGGTKTAWIPGTATDWVPTVYRPGQDPTGHDRFAGNIMAVWKPRCAWGLLLSSCMSMGRVAADHPTTWRRLVLLNICQEMQYGIRHSKQLGCPGNTRPNCLQGQPRGSLMKQLYTTATQPLFQDSLNSIMLAAAHSCRDVHHVACQ